MSRTEDIDNAIWDEADFYALNAPAKLVYIWSWTNRRCDFSGIYQVPLAAIASETKHDEQTVRDALAELERAEFVFYDGTWLWVKARVKRIKTRTVQMCKAIVKDLARVPDPHPYRLQLLELHGGRVWQSKDVRTTITAELESHSGGTRVGPGSYPVNGATAPTNGYHPSGTAVAPMTGTGTGTGTLRGRGAGKGGARSPLGYKPSTEALAMVEAHFPGEEPGTIDSTLAMLRQKRMPETPAMVRAMLGRDDEAVSV